MLAAGNAEQGGGDTSVRNDAAEGLLRLSCRDERAEHRADDL